MTQPLNKAANQPRFASSINAPALTDQELIDRALRKLGETENGRVIADFLSSGKTKIRILDDEEFRRRFPGAGAIYDPRSRDIVMPRQAVDDPSLVTTLAHEGKHALDFSTRPHWMLQSAQSILGTIPDAGKGLVTLHNPVSSWLNALNRRQNENEVNAYHLQAKVAYELGYNESSWSYGQAPDGTPLPLEEVRKGVASDPLYRLSSSRRAFLGMGLGMSTTAIAAYSVQNAASKLRPGSYLAQHAWPVFAAGAALTSAFVLADYRSTKDMRDLF